jgi:hypothetical protein
MSRTAYVLTTSFSEPLQFASTLLALQETINENPDLVGEPGFQPVQLLEPQVWPHPLHLFGLLLWVRKLESYKQAKHGGGLLQLDKYTVHFCTHQLGTLGHELYLSMTGSIVYKPKEDCGLDRCMWVVDQEPAPTWLIYNHVSAEQARSSFTTQLRNKQNLVLQAKEPAPPPVGLALVNVESKLISVYADPLAAAQKLEVSKEDLEALVAEQTTKGSFRALKF